MERRDRAGARGALAPPMPEGEEVVPLGFTILSCSLAPDSRSRILAREASRLLRERGHEPRLIDVRAFPLARFDNAEVFSDPNFAALYNAVDGADGVFIAAPVYNWSLGSEAKNLIEATGATGEGGRRAAWFDKIVTFLCSGGLPHSYMAYASLAMPLMLDFKCILNPYMVYATGSDWGPDLEMSAYLSARLEKTIDVKIELASALKARRYRSGWEV